MLSAVSEMQYHVCFISDNMKGEPALLSRPLGVMQSMRVLARISEILLMLKGDEAKSPLSLSYVYTHTQN